jgi:hypothetical protein
MSGRHGAGRGRANEEALDSNEPLEAVAGQDFEVDHEYDDYEIEKLENLDPEANDFEDASFDE